MRFIPLSSIVGCQHKYILLAFFFLCYDCCNKEAYHGIERNKNARGRRDKKIEDVYQVLECVDANMLEKYYGTAGGEGNLYKGLYARANLTTDSISGTNLDPESSYNTYPTYPLKTNDDGPTYDHTLMRNFIGEINKKNVSAS